MIGSKKVLKFINILFIIFAVIGLIQHYFLCTENMLKFRKYYFYAYLAIIVIHLFSMILCKINLKFPIVFYSFMFIELFFITILFILPSITLNILSLFIFLTIISSMIMGSIGSIVITVLTIINFIISIIIGNIRNFIFFHAPTGYGHLLDIISIVLIGLSAYIITKNYENFFEHLEQANEETIKTNYLLNNTIAELSTLQEISKFANSVLNIKELINIINDMIIGVIGVNYCSIFLIDEKTSNNFYLDSTNIKDNNIFQALKLFIASKYLPEFKLKGAVMIEGKTSDIPNYPFAEERGIKTFLITSIQSHRNLLGLIIVESTFDLAFEERKKNMLNTICNQVSIAIENAVIYEKMEKLATIDGLTQVHNRRYFNEIFLAEFGSICKSAPISVAMIDIDNFKMINDTYGHMTGDAVLKKVASIITSTLCVSHSNNYLVARYGGEEFVILMKNTDLETACNLLEVIRKNIESCIIEDDGQEVKFTVSIGVAEYPTTSSDVKQILRDADAALYKAKALGKNKVVCAEKLMSQSSSSTSL